MMSFYSTMSFGYFHNSGEQRFDWRVDAYGDSSLGSFLFCCMRFSPSKFKYSWGHYISGKPHMSEYLHTLTSTWNHFTMTIFHTKPPHILDCVDYLLTSGSDYHCTMQGSSLLETWADINELRWSLFSCFGWPVVHNHMPYLIWRCPRDWWI